jgi:AbrB family looped-hinge helix DNA binding protein
MNMVSVSEEGRIVIPASLRKKFHLKKGTKIRIEEVEGGIMVLKPLTDDPVEKSKGMLKGKTSLLKSLLEDRQKEAARE